MAVPSSPLLPALSTSSPASSFSSPSPPQRDGVSPNTLPVTPPPATFTVSTPSPVGMTTPPTLGRPTSAGTPSPQAAAAGVSPPGTKGLGGPVDGKKRNSLEHTSAARAAEIKEAFKQKERADEATFTALFAKKFRARKVGRDGKRKECDVWLSGVESGQPAPLSSIPPQCAILHWGDKHEACTAITDVQEGRKSAVFTVFDSKRKNEAKSELEAEEARSLTIVFKKRTLDLELLPSATAPQDRKQYADGFRWLKMRASKPAVSTGPFNVKHNTHVTTDFKWSGENLEETVELKHKLGQGAFGTVYRANIHGIEMAVKTVQAKNAEAIAEVKGEMAILQQCRSPQIVGYYGCWGPDSQNRLWIMMDYCGVGSVVDLVEDSGTKLTEHMVAYIMCSTLLALNYLNGRNIIHRDVKARNLLVNKDGDCKLADFGVSKSLHRAGDGDDKAALQNSGGGIAGSPLWMSPEVISGKEADAKADIWALGITAIEIAERRIPNEELGITARVMRAIATNPSPTLRDPLWTPQFRDFLAKCLIKDPKERPDAATLLRHPFITSAPMTGDILKPSIKLCFWKKQRDEREKKKKIAAAEELRLKKQKAAAAAAAAAAGPGIPKPKRERKPSLMESVFGKKNPSDSGSTSNGSGGSAASPHSSQRGNNPSSSTSSSQNPHGSQSLTSAPLLNEDGEGDGDFDGGDDTITGGDDSDTVERTAGDSDDEMISVARKDTLTGANKDDDDGQFDDDTDEVKAPAAAPTAAATSAAAPSTTASTTSSSSSAAESSSSSVTTSTTASSTSSTAPLAPSTAASYGTTESVGSQTVGSTTSTTAVSSSPVPPPATSPVPSVTTKPFTPAASVSPVDDSNGGDMSPTLLDPNHPTTSVGVRPRPSPKSAADSSSSSATTAAASSSSTAPLLPSSSSGDSSSGTGADHSPRHHPQPTSVQALLSSANIDWTTALIAIFIAAAVAIVFFTQAHAIDSTIVRAIVTIPVTLLSAIVAYLVVARVRRHIAPNGQRGYTELRSTPEA